ERRHFRTDKEVTRLAREHDRLVGRVDPLRAERRGRFAQPLPGVLQILRQLPRQRRFRRRPAIVRLAFRDPLLAVVALMTCHLFFDIQERIGSEVPQFRSSEVLKSLVPEVLENPGTPEPRNRRCSFHIAVLVHRNSISSWILSSTLSSLASDGFVMLKSANWTVVVARPPTDVLPKVATTFQIVSLVTP